MSYSWRNGSFSRAARDYVLEQNRRTQEALLRNAQKNTADNNDETPPKENHMTTKAPQPIEVGMTLDGLSQADVDALRGAENDGGAVRLPFDAIYCYALSGQRNLKDAAPALYFGGIATDAEDVADLQTSGAIAGFPKWNQYTGSGKDGDYTNLCSRTIHMAFIKGRYSWVKDGGRSTEYAPGARRHLQYLGGMFAGVKSEGVARFDYVGPCVLTAKGMQVSRVFDAIGQWEKAVKSVSRTVNAQNFPRCAWVFTIGTSGDKPEFETVGKGANQKDITPMRALIPDAFDVAALKARFVGRERIAKFAELLAQADTWLNAWKVNGPTSAWFHVPQINGQPEDEEPF